MRKIVVTAFVMLVVILGGGGDADAQSWQTDNWAEGGPDAEFVVTGPGTLEVTDFQCPGDDYRVYVDGVLVGTISNTQPTSCSLAVENDPTLACISPLFASGNFPISAGAHSVRLEVFDGFDFGSAAVRVVADGGTCVPAGGVGGDASVKAFCIESDEIQENPALQGNRIADLFFDDGVEGHISSGPPTCSYNCIDGFDINCDGKIGDFCPVEIDRTLVSSVQPCLEASQAQAPADAAAPAVPAAAPVAAVPAPSVVTLAHTGSENTLGLFVGTAFLGFGASALGAAHVLRRRSNKI